MRRNTPCHFRGRVRNWRLAVPYNKRITLHANSRVVIYIPTLLSIAGYTTRHGVFGIVRHACRTL